MEQYFRKNPISKSVEKHFDFYFRGFAFHFTSDNGVFSKNQVDFGTELLLKTILENQENDPLTIADAGCGIGVVGVVLGKFMKNSSFTMLDINERALTCAKKNLLDNGVKNADVVSSDFFSRIQKNFDCIITNPPIRAGKEVVFRLYHEAYEHLNHEGEFYVVIQKKQGALSSIKKLEEIFLNCMVLNKKAGYYVLQCKKVSKEPNIGS